MEKIRNQSRIILWLLLYQYEGAPVPQQWFDDFKLCRKTMNIPRTFPAHGGILCTNVLENKVECKSIVFIL
jgi:hypothetical protein